MSDVRLNEITTLATAAPDIYAIPFGKKSVYIYYSTTSHISDDWVENIKVTSNNWSDLVN